MHLISTNICVWLNVEFITVTTRTLSPLFQVLIMETKHDLEHRPHHQGVHQAGQHMGEGEEWSVVSITAIY